VRPSDSNRAETWISGANPYPDAEELRGTDLAERVAQATAQRITDPPALQGRKTMLTRPRTETRGSTSRKIGGLAAASAAAIVVVIVGGTALLLANRVPPSTDPPAAAATPTTTIGTAPSTTEPMTTTSGTTPVAAENAVMEWALLTFDGSGYVNTVESTSFGLVAGGASEGVPMIWRSDDGSTWQELPPSSTAADTIPSGGVHSIAVADGTAIALIGDEVWHSTDLVSWSPADPRPFSGEGKVNLEAVAHGPSGWVIAGWESDPKEDYLIDHGVFWQSPDGLTWNRVEVPDPEAAIAFDVVMFEEKFVAVGLDWTPGPLHVGIWTSVDGLTWVQGATPDPFGGVTMAGVTATPSGLYAVGNYSPELASPEQEGYGCVAIWHSDDAETWTRLEISDEDACNRQGTYGYAIAGSNGRFVAVGESQPKSVAASQAGVWASTDLESGWTKIVTPGDVLGVDANTTVSMADIVQLVDGYLAVGVYDQKPAMWIGQWTEQP